MAHSLTSFKSLLNITISVGPWPPDLSSPLSLLCLISLYSISHFQLYYVIYLFIMFIVCLSPLTLSGRIAIIFQKLTRKRKTKQQPGIQPHTSLGEAPWSPWLKPRCAICAIGCCCWPCWPWKLSAASIHVQKWTFKAPASSPQQTLSNAAEQLSWTERGWESRC